jgi:hypothetical protein
MMKQSHKKDGGGEKWIKVVEMVWEGFRIGGYCFCYFKEYQMTRILLFIFNTYNFYFVRSGIKFEESFRTRAKHL